MDLCPSERCEKGNVDEHSIEIGQTGIHQGEAKKVSDAIDAIDSGRRVICSRLWILQNSNHFPNKGKGYSPALATR